MKTYKEASAAWAYTAALAAFRREGKTKESSRLIKAALKSNPHVPGFLLGARKLPDASPSFIGMGDEDEAVSYVEENAEAWVGRAGALDWLRMHASPAKRTARKA